MHRFGKILALSACIVAVAFVPHTAQIPNDLGESIGDSAGADRVIDAEYKKLELEYMNADVQASIGSRGEKTTLDELTATRARNTALENERVKLMLQKEAAGRTQP